MADVHQKLCFYSDPRIELQVRLRVCAKAANGNFKSATATVRNRMKERSRADERARADLRRDTPIGGMAFVQFVQFVQIMQVMQFLSQNCLITQPPKWLTLSKWQNRVRLRREWCFPLEDMKAGTYTYGDEMRTKRYQIPKVSWQFILCPASSNFTFSIASLCIQRYHLYRYCLNATVLRFESYYSLLYLPYHPYQVKRRQEKLNRDG